MTGSDVLSICLTVGVVQILCDLLAKYLIFTKEPFLRAVASLERARWKRDKAEVDAKKNDKHAKRLQRAQDDYSEACSEVARRHTGPGIITSVIFVILLRVLGTEHKGNVMGLLPFVPFQFLQRFTARGLDMKELMQADVFGQDTGDNNNPDKVNVQQAVSFLFVYVLATFSIKYYVHQIVGTAAPEGADKGIMSIMESPKGHRLMKSLGIDPNDLK
jgi:uncharacterized membrane protein (DUF106 family)